MGFETYHGLMKTPSKPKFFKHLEGLQVRAEFSDCGNFRYLLEIIRDTNKQERRVCAVMLNPSIANDKQADKSVQFLEKLIFEKPSSYFKNISGLTIVNLFAYIQTRNFEGSPEQVGPLNDQYLQMAISEADMVLIAWGKTCDYPERQAFVMKALEKTPEKPVFITNSHPSRGTYKDFVRPVNTK